MATKKKSKKRAAPSSASRKATKKKSVKRAAAKAPDKPEGDEDPLIRDLGVEELRARCQKSGLNSRGGKAVLIERLEMMAYSHGLAVELRKTRTQLDNARTALGLSSANPQVDGEVRFVIAALVSSVGVPRVLELVADYESGLKFAAAVSNRNEPEDA